MPNSVCFFLAIIVSDATCDALSCGYPCSFDMLCLPLWRRHRLRHEEGGGRNATGLARQSPQSMQMPTGELSPMAFLGGGVWGGRGRSPPPDASSDLDRPSHMRRGRQ